MICPHKFVSPQSKRRSNWRYAVTGATLSDQVTGPTANAGDVRDMDSIPGSGRSGGWYDNPL